MNIYIGIEDLAANALIILLKKENKRFISYDEMRLYGNKVLELLNDDANKAVLIMSGNNTDAFFRDYSDFFEERKEGEKSGIYLRDEKNENDLIKKFRGYLSLEALLAFVNEEAISALGV